MLAIVAQFRRPLTRAALLLTLGITLLTLTGCKKNEESAAAPPAPGTPPAAEAPAPAPPKAEPPTEFKALWPVGQRLVLRLETTADLEVQVPPTTTAVKLPAALGSSLTQVLDLAFTALKERDSGGHEVEVETLAITTTNRFGTNTTGFTTRSDPKQDPKNFQPAPALRKLVGGKVKLLTTAEGKVEKLEGGPQFRSKGTVGASPIALGTINNLFSDESIKGWNTLHTGLPDKPVKVGDTWPATRTYNYGAALLTLDTTNTFKAWEQRDGRKVARFEQTGTLTTKPPAPGSLVAITLDDGAKITGKAWFDPALGAIVESTLNAEFGIKISYVSNPGTASKVKATLNARLTDAPNPGAAAAAEAKPAEPAPAAPPAPAPPAKP